MRSTLGLLSLLLLGCAAPAVCGGCSDDGGLPGGELPDSFRVEAEIVSLEPIAPITSAGACDPNEAIAGAPDWAPRFSDALGPVPKFAADGVGDSARCTAADGSDCCTALVDTGDGWRLTCNGRKEAAGQRVFVFDFAADGSGSATSTFTSVGAGGCRATMAWSAVEPI